MSGTDPRTGGTPVGWSGSGPDFEVYGKGPFEWVAYDEDVCIGTGRARTRFGAQLQISRFMRRERKREARDLDGGHPNAGPHVSRQ